jgi:hypothetical protein
LTRRRGLSHPRLTPNEIRLLQEVLTADYKNSNVRLREGEYQFILAKTIASFHLELYFPNVKDIVKRLYGEEKINDLQFIRMIQTILKKLEKNNVLKILPKKSPWELQRYALSSFKFQDSDKNLIILATEEQIKQTQELLHSILTQQKPSRSKLFNAKISISILLLIMVVSYITIMWNLMQSVISPIILIPTLSIAVICAILLGKILSGE